MQLKKKIRTQHGSFRALHTTLVSNIGRDPELVQSIVLDRIVPRVKASNYEDPMSMVQLLSAIIENGAKCGQVEIRSTYLISVQSPFWCI